MEQVKGIDLIRKKEKYKRSLVINFFIFVLFYVIFYAYQDTSVYGSTALLVVVNTLILAIYIAAIFRTKLGVIIFVFLIPLLNTITTILEVRRIPIILYLFFGLFLGFIINRGSDAIKERWFNYKENTFFDPLIGIPIAILIIILIVSVSITIYRYANFYPFLSSKYYDLAVNINGIGSTSSIFWTLRYFFNYVAGFGLILVLYNSLKKVKDIIRVLVALMISSVFSAAVLAYQYFFEPTLGSFRNWVESGRFNATFSDPNALGAFTVFLLPVCFVLIIYLRRWYAKLIFSLLFILFFIMLILSGSRSAILGIMFSALFLVVLFILLAVRLLRKKLGSLTSRKKIIIVIAIILAIIIIVTSISVFLFSDPVIQRIKSIPELKRVITTINTGISFTKRMGIIEGFKSISNYRYIYWGQAIQMFKDYPANGVGQGAYIIQLPNYLAANRAGIFSDGYYVTDFTGNYYLQVMSELGLPGIILILFIFFAVLKKIFSFLKKGESISRTDNHKWVLLGLSISYISFLIVQFFGPHTNFLEVQFSFWLIIGLILVYVKITQNNRGENFRYSQVPIWTPGYRLKEKTALALILIIFSGSFFISSFTDLSINIQQNQFDIKSNYKGWENNYGFYDFETSDQGSFRWVGMDASQVIENSRGVMIIPVKDSDPKTHKIPLFIRFFINNQLVKVIKINDKEWYEVKIDLSDFKQDLLTFTMSCSRSWTPKERGLSNDTRELGVMSGEFKFLK